MSRRDARIIRVSLRDDPRPCCLHATVEQSGNSARNARFDYAEGAHLNAYARFFLCAGGVAAFIAVAMGAFGAHALKNTISPAHLVIYQTAVQYHFYHALGLLAVGVVTFSITGSRLLNLAGALMIPGILLFSGSLYALALTGAPLWGLITPIGGLALLGAWGLFTAAVARHCNLKSRDNRGTA